MSEDRQSFEELEGSSALEVLSWTFERFDLRRVALACSFGVEDMALLDLCDELGRFPRIVSLDTGRLPEQTHLLIDQARARYPKAAIEVFCPDASEVQSMVESRGQNLFYADVASRKLCCDVRKVRPLRRALHGCDAWITGLRRAQSADRSAVKKAAHDPAFGLLKICPIADWSDEEVWQRVRARKVPYNLLHDDGYPSIGCAPCTRAVKPGEDARAGRWWWEQPTAAKECGLHPAKR